MSNLEYLNRHITKLKENKPLIDAEIKQINDFLAIKDDVFEILQSWQGKQINKRLADKLHALNSRLYLSKQPYFPDEWQLRFYRENQYTNEDYFFSYLKLPDKMDDATLEKIHGIIEKTAQSKIERKEKILANIKKAPAKIKKLCELADEINSILETLDYTTKEAASIKLSTLFV